MDMPALQEAHVTETMVMYAVTKVKSRDVPDVVSVSSRVT